MWVYVLWGLIVLTTLLDIKRVPMHIQALKDGWNGIIFLPVAILILYPTLFIALALANYFPILNWGWLGTNIVAAPLADVVTASDAAIASGAASGVDIVTILQLVGFALTIFFLCLIANYYEEESFRATWKMVVIWALLHLIMGIPLYALIPIFCLGVLYKVVHDKYSFNRAFALHFATNVTIISLVVVVVILGI